MSNDPLTPAQVREVEQIAELQTRRYFDHYLIDIWPVQAKALRDDMITAVQAHDDAEDAHGKVEMKVNRLIWLMLGAASFGGASGGILVGLLKQVAPVL